jgi:hypothetical protein
MLPVLILVLPPSIAAGGYGCWSLGNRTALSFMGHGPRNTPVTPLKYSGVSKALAIATFAGVYGAFSTTFPTGIYQESAKDLEVAKTKVEASMSEFVPPHKRAESDRFQPPKTIAEATKRFGRPIMTRAGALGVALFCAGTVQTVAAKKHFLKV